MYASGTDACTLKEPIDVQRENTVSSDNIYTVRSFRTNGGDLFTLFSDTLTIVMRSICNRNFIRIVDVLRVEPRQR